MEEVVARRFGVRVTLEDGVVGGGCERGEGRGEMSGVRESKRGKIEGRGCA